MRRILFLLLVVLPLSLPQSVLGSEGGYRLDKSPHDSRDLVSLQAGARTFVNYCQGCHGMQYMRFNRLTDLGLTEAQIQEYLLFSAEKVGETMKTALPQKEGKVWFGVAPPDLSVIARARGADWLYTYLRTFYRDPKSATGWNNAVFPSVAMPHALWTLQGERSLEAAMGKDLAGHEHMQYKWSQLTPGSLNGVEYDALTRDLVNFLVYAGEPAATSRRAIGIVVLFVLGVVFIFAWLLKREYWKDVK